MIHLTPNELRQYGNNLLQALIQDMEVFDTNPDHGVFCDCPNHNSAEYIITKVKSLIEARMKN